MEVRSTAMPVPSIRFDRFKYGSHLLADACSVASLPYFIKTPRLHRLAFYEVALITEGRGALALDGLALEITPYRVCITAPGEIRSWRLEGERLGGLLAFVSAAADGARSMRAARNRRASTRRFAARERRPPTPSAASSFR
jgi:hypothetical protein